ncbi:hypothetical protein IMZ48_13530 [Candidatus Bathyarchaeota archaeon]|nr:hypothetical protein [Candidatus Bathyarchaeota archaeon]
MGFLSRKSKPAAITDPLPPAQSPFLRTLQTGLRALQLTAAVAVLAIYSYTLGALANRGLKTPVNVRAVEGIVGVTVAYAIACTVLLRLFATRTFSAFVLIFFDVTFAAAWIYVAVANGGGASCSGEVETHFGKGKVEDDVKGESDGFMALPKFGDACRLLTASLAISILSM